MSGRSLAKAVLAVLVAACVASAAALCPGCGVDGGDDGGSGGRDVGGKPQAATVPWAPVERPKTHPWRGAGDRSGEVAARLEWMARMGLGARVEAHWGVGDEALLADLERLASLVRHAVGGGGMGARRSKYVLLNNSGTKEYDFAAAQAAGDLVSQVSGAVELHGRLEYPVDPAISRKVGDEPLPVILLPRDDLLAQALAEFRADAEAGRAVAVPSAGTVWFMPFVSDVLESFQCPTPADGDLVGRELPVSPRFKMHVSPAEQGRVVSQGVRLNQAMSLLDEAHARVLGRAETFLAWEGLYFVRYRIDGEGTLWSWAAPVADGNGGARWTREGNRMSYEAYTNQVSVHPVYGSRYENVVGGIGWRKVGRHDLRVLPRPIPVVELAQVRARAVWLPPELQPQEAITVTREFVREHHVLVLRKAASWLPFMEDVEFDERLSFHGEDADSALALIVSGDASEEELRAAIDAYYGLVTK